MFIIVSSKLASQSKSPSVVISGLLLRGSNTIIILVNLNCNSKSISLESFHCRVNKKIGRKCLVSHINYNFIISILIRLEFTIVSTLST